MHLKQSVEENLSAFPCQSRNDMQLNGKDLILKKRKNMNPAHTHFRNGHSYFVTIPCITMLDHFEISVYSSRIHVLLCFELWAI